MNQDSSITGIKGIGEKTRDLFAKMGVYTVGDILLRFPRTYIQYPKAEPIDELTSLTEENHAIAAKIERTPVVKSGRRMQVERGKYFVFYGTVHIKDNRYVMEQPAVYTPEAYQKIEGCFLPVYSLTAGISNNLMIKTMRQVLDDNELLLDFLPADIRQEYQLCEYNYAMKQIHFPDTMDSLIAARHRLVFDEFFLFIMGMQYQKEKRGRQENPFVMQNP